MICRKYRQRSRSRRTDSTKFNPVDLRWIAEHDPFGCRIIRLGKCKAHLRFTTSNALYRELLLKMISANVVVIHKESLEAINAHYLEVHPDAEGIPLLAAKRQIVNLRNVEEKAPAPSEETKRNE